MSSYLPLLDKYGIKDPPCGSEIPTGWTALVDDLISDLIELGWDKDLQQVKEKFGGLRFYIGEGSTEVYDRITKAEKLSFKLCIDCGSDVDVTRVKGYYIAYTCAKCKEKASDSQGT